LEASDENKIDVKMEPTESPDRSNQATWWVSFLYQEKNKKVIWSNWFFKNGTIFFTSEE